MMDSSGILGRLHLFIVVPAVCEGFRCLVSNFPRLDAFRRHVERPCTTRLPLDKQDSKDQMIPRVSSLLSSVALGHVKKQIIIIAKPCNCGSPMISAR
jgi:hypothetical protein